MSTRPSTLAVVVGRHLLTGLICTLWAACGNTPHSSTTTVVNPTAPTAAPESVGASAAATSGSTTSAVRAWAESAATSDALSAASASAPQPFPPRDQSFSFRLELEQIYRTELGRAATSNYFDVEGDLVWTQEYMRYRVYACSHLEAVQKVFDQIDRGVIAPACGMVSGSAVMFPPYADAIDFRQRLDAKYRDDLRRTPSPTFVDAEGAIVWTERYLRYRVFACDDATARAAVRAQIRGGPPAPFCFAVATAREILGHWSGTIAMPEPRPFTMDITGRSGGEYFGSYRDIAFGSVSLTWDGEDRVDFFVYFGDGSGTFQGQFVAPDRARGTMKYDKIATVFEFDMTRH